MCGEYDPLPDLFREGLMREYESRRLFSARALMDHGECTVDDLLMILERVPKLRMEVSEKLFAHHELSPEHLVEMARLYPKELFARAWVALKEHPDAKGSHRGELRRLLGESGSSVVPDVNTHHYWWPAHAYGAKKRRKVMSTPPSVHSDYHRHFLAECKEAASRFCHEGGCKFEKLCCYYRTWRPFPEAIN